MNKIIFQYSIEFGKLPRNRINHCTFCIVINKDWNTLEYISIFVDYPDEMFITY